MDKVLGLSSLLLDNEWMMQAVAKEAFLLGFTAESALTLPGWTNGQASAYLKCQQ